MLTTIEIDYLRKELASAKNPLFFYDDDPDGLCSFLLMYRIQREGTGILVKSAPKLDLQLYRKVEELTPDKIFVLDIPILEQEFVDKANRPIFYIDHHQPLTLHKVHYYNPRIMDPEAYLPTTRMAYQVNGRSEDLWIATIGCLADWYMPDFIEEFIAAYPHLLPKKNDLADAVYHQPIGKLIRIFSFLLKGPTLEVRRCVKILTRVNSPDEILQQTTTQGKFLYKHFQSINHHYEALLKAARKKVSRSKILLFSYTEKQCSFTSDLSNELSSLYPKKVIIIARHKSNEMKCSLRAKIPIDQALKVALEGLRGYGGGHPNACGTVVHEEDWDTFLARFKEELERQDVK